MSHPPPSATVAAPLAPSPSGLNSPTPPATSNATDHFHAEPSARVDLTPDVAQQLPYFNRAAHAPGSTSTLSISHEEGASTSAPSLFAFFRQFALHGGRPSFHGRPSSEDTHVEGVEGSGMSEEDFSDSSDTEENDGLSTLSVDEDEDEKGDLAPLPDQQSIGKHQVFRPSAYRDSDNSFNISNRLAQLAVSNLASGAQEHAHGPISLDDGWTEEEKLEAIKDEFGVFQEQLGDGRVCTVDEEFLGEAVGGLFRGILILGNLHLTSHRLTFLARIPPVSSKKLSSGSVIKAGAVWILKHRTHLGIPCTRKKRVWLELSADMATTYPDSTEQGRTRPLKTILLGTVRRIREEKEERVIEVELHTTKGSPPDIRRLEFDTHESALAWRRELEAALFHFDRQRRLLMRKAEASSSGAENGAEGVGDDAEWERVRVSLPLERIERETATEYMSFAMLVDLEVDNAASPADPPLPGSSESTSSKPSSPKQLKVDPSDLQRSRTHANKIHLQFALLSSQHAFVKAFERARKAALERKKHCGASNGGCMPPLVDLEDVFKDYLRRGEAGEVLQDESGQELEGAGAGLDATEETLRTVFGLGNSEGLWSISCGLQRALIPLKGQLVVSPRYIGFYRRAVAGSDLKLRFDIADVKSATKWSTMHLSTKGMALHIHGHPSMHLEFFSRESRNLAITHVNDAVAMFAVRNPSVSRAAASLASETPTPPLDHTLSNGQTTTSPSATTFDLSQDRAEARGPSAKSHGYHSHQRSVSKSDDILSSPLRSPDPQPKPFGDAAFNYVPRVVNLPQDVQERTVKRVAPRHFCMLTIGSRGDVQPYIALSLGLMRDGHRCTIITHEEFRGWVESFGIGFRQAGGDPAALMKLSVEHKMFSPGFFKESLGHFRQWLDDLLHDAWVACHDADVLIESPSAMAGIHVAEALHIPYFRAFTMPWTATHDYPQAFMVPQIEMSGAFYYSTYVLFDNILWKATAGQVNRWRRKELNLPKTDMSHMDSAQVPFLYNFSSAVVPQPLDWKDNITITGYWFMPGDADEGWTPPADLEAFIKKARDDQVPLVYVGFGSIVVPNPAETTRSIIRAVERAGVRAIVAKGWSGRGGEVDKNGQPIEVPLPESCFSLEKVPHDWLMPRIDAAVHHGGAGTTGASLRAGIPTIIKPWFGDQFFWALRVQKLGAGIRVNSLSNNELSDALIKATSDDLMRETASKIGEKIRAERGVERAIEWLYSYLERARDRHQSSGPRSSSPALRGTTISTPCSPLPSGASSPSGSPKLGPLKASPSLSGLGSKGIRGFKEAGSAVVSVGRLGSALKGMAKGAGSGSGA